MKFLCFVKCIDIPTEPGLKNRCAGVYSMKMTNFCKSKSCNLTVIQSSLQLCYINDNHMDNSISFILKAERGSFKVSFTRDLPRGFIKNSLWAIVL